MLFWQTILKGEVVLPSPAARDVPSLPLGYQLSGAHVYEGNFLQVQTLTGCFTPKVFT